MNNEIMKNERIRALALGIVWRGGDSDEFLVCEFYDQITGEPFYRPLGGGIEFWERAQETLRREFREELGAELVDVRYTATLENIFVHEGRRGHEIILLYKAALADPSLYERETLTVNENGQVLTARWMALREFPPGGPPLYPDGLPELLASEDTRL